MSVKVEISIGELLDKISILKIKRKHIKDPQKVENISRELALLDQVRPTNLAGELVQLEHRLFEVNQELWDLELSVRTPQSESEFGEAFIAHARRIIYTNDLRATIKRKINELTESTLIEEKEYRLDTAAINLD